MLSSGLGLQCVCMAKGRVKPGDVPSRRPLWEPKEEHKGLVVDPASGARPPGPRTRPGYWCGGLGRSGLPHRSQPCGQSKGRGGRVCRARDSGTGWAAPATGGSGVRPSSSSPLPPSQAARPVLRAGPQPRPHGLQEEPRRPRAHEPHHPDARAPGTSKAATAPRGAGAQGAHAPGPRLRLLCPPGLACSMPALSPAL